jgi:hypothetical protein
MFYLRQYQMEQRFWQRSPAREPAAQEAQRQPRLPATSVLWLQALQ